MFCVNCGTKIEDNFKYCPLCSLPINQTPADNKTDNKTEYAVTHKRKLIGTALFVAIALLTVLILSVNSLPHGAPSVDQFIDIAEDNGYAVTARQLNSDASDLNELLGQRWDSQPGFISLDYDIRSFVKTEYDNTSLYYICTNSTSGDTARSSFRELFELLTMFELDAHDWEHAVTGRTNSGGWVLNYWVDAYNDEMCILAQKGEYLLCILGCPSEKYHLMPLLNTLHIDADTILYTNDDWISPSEDMLLEENGVFRIGDAPLLYEFIVMAENNGFIVDNTGTGSEFSNFILETESESYVTAESISPYGDMIYIRADSEDIAEIAYNLVSRDIEEYYLDTYYDYEWLSYGTFSSGGWQISCYIDNWDKEILIAAQKYEYLLVVEGHTNDIYNFRSLFSEMGMDGDLIFSSEGQG